MTTRDKTEQKNESKTTATSDFFPSFALVWLKLRFADQYAAHLCVPLTPTRGLPRFWRLLLAQLAAPKSASISKGYRVDLESYRLPRAVKCRYSSRSYAPFFSECSLHFFNAKEESGLFREFYFGSIVWSSLSRTSSSLEGLTLNRCRSDRHDLCCTQWALYIHYDFLSRSCVPIMTRCA